MKRVWACRRCGEESSRDTEVCAICGGEIEEVDPVLIAILETLETVLGTGQREVG